MWNDSTADTQFQRPASSHELAAITLTEVVNFSTKINSKPAFVLYLDAKSAFDLVLREFLISDLYELGVSDQSLLLINQRLKNRKTICEWNQTLMGPIQDECGVEQGGPNSSDYYKIYNNEQLKLAQTSKFGIEIGSVTISSIGQADDVVLVADNPHALQGLLDLSLYFCKKKHVTLSPGKTKLQAFSSSKKVHPVPIVPTDICIDGVPVDLVHQAEHVGIVRSVQGNLAHIQSRFSAHRKQLGALLPAGLAKGHRANPVSTLKAFQTYCLPVLLSGTAALVLRSTEVQLIEQHVKDTLCSLQKLLPGTPPCVVFFLGGHLPATAHLHKRQLTLFGMVCLQRESVLLKVFEFLLSTSSSSNGSWIMQIRQLCIQYGLPSPLSLIQCPLSKTEFRSLIRSHVINYWELKLRSDAMLLPSLQYFKPHYMSLVNPHPLWSSCTSNPFEVNKAIVQARMLSGRYPTDQLTRHWNQRNKAGLCLLEGCSGQTLGTLQHILLECPALCSTRQNLIGLLHKTACMYPLVADVLYKSFYTPDQSLTMQFLLDCTVLPAVVTLVQANGGELLHQLFYISRNWCYSVHRKRMEMLGLYKYR